MLFWIRTSDAVTLQFFQRNLDNQGNSGRRVNIAIPLNKGRRAFLMLFY